MIKVLVADDHPLLRMGVADLLGRTSGILVAGEASSGRGVLEAAVSVTPDVVVVDLTMPYDDDAPVTRTFSTGIDAIAALKSLPSSPAVVVLTVHGEAGIVRAALRAGASGYVLKESVSADLVLAVRAAAAGSLYLSAEVAAMIRPHGGEAVKDADRLSPRERQVVQLVVDGLSTKQIAAHLSTSPKTVEKQRRNAMRKLDAPNIAALVRTVADATWVN